jgi:hypothetical protein
MLQKRNENENSRVVMGVMQAVLGERSKSEVVDRFGGPTL